MIILGQTNIQDKEVKILEGGFGEGQKCIVDKQIADIHSMQTKHVRELINKNIKRFKEGIDYIDLKQGVEYIDPLLELGYNKSAITQAKNIYVLSERGYSKVIKIMDSDLAWDIHDELIDNYFAMRNQLKLMSFQIEDPIERAKKFIEEQEEIKLLIAKKDEIIGELSPFAKVAQERMCNDGTISFTDARKSFELKQGQIKNWGINNGYLHATQKEVNNKGDRYFKVVSDKDGHKNIAIREEGIALIDENIEYIRKTECKRRKLNK